MGRNKTWFSWLHPVTIFTENHTQQIVSGCHGVDCFDFALCSALSSIVIPRHQETMTAGGWQKDGEYVSMIPSTNCDSSSPLLWMDAAYPSCLGERGAWRESPAHRYRNNLSDRQTDRSPREIHAHVHTLGQFGAQFSHRFTYSVNECLPTVGESWSTRKEPTQV